MCGCGEDLAVHDVGVVSKIFSFSSPVQQKISFVGQVVSSPG